MLSNVRKSLVFYAPSVFGRFFEPFPEYFVEPYGFSEPDSDENLVLVAREGRLQAWSAGASLDVPVIRAASFSKLIERLTYHAYPDPELIDTFLLTYRSIATPHELLVALIRRYHVRRQDALNADEADQMATVQQRVINVLKAWIKNYWMDFDDGAMLQLLQRFIVDKIGTADENAAVSQRLSELVARRQAEWRARSIPVLSMRIDAPPSFVTAEWLHERLMSFSPSDVAEQLTLLQSELFQSIPPYEFLAKVWKKASRTASHVNLDRLIESFNATSAWVVLSVLTPRRPEERARALRFYIKMCLRFRELNNFDGVMCLVSAYEGAAVHRLHRSWEGVSAKKRAAYAELKALMAHDSSFKRYRQALRECAPPCVPYIGLYLTDLTFVCDGNEDWFKRQPKRGATAADVPSPTPPARAASSSDIQTPASTPALPAKAASSAAIIAAPAAPGAFPAAPAAAVDAREKEPMINFEKRRMFARAVAEVRQYQNERYADIVPIQALQQLLLHAHALAKTRTEEETYALSLEREPREPRK